MPNPSIPTQRDTGALLPGNSSELFAAALFRFRRITVFYEQRQTCNTCFKNVLSLVVQKRVTADTDSELLYF